MKKSLMISNGMEITFAFGSEGFGMREHTKKYTDFLVKIDINKNIESLNICQCSNRHHINQYKNKPIILKSNKTQ